MDKLRTGVLGAGGMGGSVIKHLKNCDDVAAITVYDINPDRAEQKADKFGVTAMTPTRTS